MQMQNNNDNISLDDLEYSKSENFDNISINVESEKNKENDMEKLEKNQNLFDRKLKCPVCDSNITVRSVRSSSIKTVSRDTDFMVHYSDPNPMLYDAWVCINCGYAAISSQFSNITYKQKIAIKDQICAKWKTRNYPLEYDIDTSIERYKLALLSAIVKNSNHSEKALICLKLGWHYRLKGDIENEKNFLRQAKSGFEIAFEKESFPIGGMDEPTLNYLIGELYRRLGDNQDALKWLSRALYHNMAKSKIKDMAREQKYLITQSNTEKDIPAENNVKSHDKRHKKRLFAKLFS